MTALHASPASIATGRDAPRSKNVASGSVRPRLDTIAAIAPVSSTMTWLLKRAPVPSKVGAPNATASPSDAARSRTSSIAGSTSPGFPHSTMRR